MRMNMATPLVIYYDVVRGQKKMDVHFECPFCSRRSHLVIIGNKKADAAYNFLHGAEMLTQSLPFEAPERTFLRDGICRECQETMFSNTSKNIKYVARERR